MLGGLFSILLVFFVPKFGELFDQLRNLGELPAVTDWLLWFSGSLRSYGLIILAVLTILYFVARVQLNTDKGRLMMDRIKIKIPMFGPIFLNLAVGRFCRVLGTLLRNGVPILKALEISRDASGNQTVECSSRHWIILVSQRRAPGWWETI